MQSPVCPNSEILRRENWYLENILVTELQLVVKN